MTTTRQGPDGINEVIPFESLRNGIIDQGKTVSYTRKIYEVPTADGENLVMIQKSPVETSPKGYVMLVHGLGQNRFSWTLSKRSFENYLVSKGFSTFNVELRGHGLSRANGSGHPEKFETYLYYDMPAFMETIRRIVGGKKYFLVGHSLGGSIAYCMGPEYTDDLAGIVSIAGPFNMAKGNILLKAIAYLGVALGRLYPFGKMQPKVFYIDYIGLVARYGLCILDSPWYKLPLQVWYPGSIEKEILEERITRGFDRTGFGVIKYFFEWGARGRFESTDGDVDFEERMADLRAPILFVCGNRDVAVPVEAVREAYEKAGSRDKAMMVFGNEEPGLHFGHCDLVCGKAAPRIVWPRIVSWMAERAGF